MLGRLDLVLESPRVNVMMGSLFHGFIMETIDTEYAERLHQMNVKPFSQFLFFEKKSGRYIWRVNTLNEEALIKIIGRLQRTKDVRLRHRDLTISIIDQREFKPIEFDTFIHSIFLREPQKHTTLRFMTPTAFKSKGKYVNVPSPDLIYKSSALKLNEFARQIKMMDNAVFEVLSDSSNITKYRLNSRMFHVEGIRVNAFEGELRIHIKDNDEIKKLGNMLMALTAYTGLGIKTAMGMGGMEIE